MKIYLIDSVYWIKPHILQRAEAAISTSMATQNFYKKYEPTKTRRLKAKTIKILTSLKGNLEISILLLFI